MANVLVVDGYNIIGAWPELKALQERDMAEARDRLIEYLAEYQAFSNERILIVFDAYNVPGLEYKHKTYNLEIIYTKEKETADECIERLVKSLKNVKNQVYVATSDYAEQRTIFAQGALRKSARELYIELRDIEGLIHENIKVQKKKKPQIKIPISPEVKKVFEKWRRGKE